MAQAQLVEALNDHLNVLAERLGCELRMSGDTPGMMWVEWALDNACYPPTKECALFMWNTCMGNYYASSTPGQRVFLGNRDRAYVTDAKWDTPDAYFWGIRERMLSYTKEKVA